MARMTRSEQLRARLLGSPEDDFRAPRQYGWMAYAKGMAEERLPRRLGFLAPLIDWLSLLWMRLRMSRMGWLVGLGWGGPLFFMLLGGLLRFWHLGAPHELVFDETYYVKQGWSLINFGVEMKADPILDAAKQVDEHFTANDPWIYGPQSDVVVHPPFGKWVIGAGEAIFGIYNSFGWRFSVALLGTLSILIVGRVARRLMHSDLLGTVAAALLAFEGHHFVQSRTGLLDTVVMFTGLISFAALLIDRDKSREVLIRKLGDTDPRAWPWGGPWLGWRPWRWVMGICLGLSCATKWSGLYWLVAFGLLSVFWDMGARRTAGVRGWWAAWFPMDSLYAFVSVVGAAVVTYVATWAGWIFTTVGPYRDWAAKQPGPKSIIPNWARSLWHYHAEMFDLTQRITSSHPYQSSAWSWIVQGRPTSFYYNGPKRGEHGCLVNECSRAISIVILAFMWLLRRDWRAGAILVALLAGWVPWFFLGTRTIYAFYEVAFVPYAVLACTYVCGLAIGGRDATRSRRRDGLIATGIFVLLTIVLFWWFWPVYTAQVIPLREWQMRMWFPSWV